MLYSSVFVEKVFSVSINNRQGHQQARYNGNSQDKPRRCWGLQDIGGGFDDYLVVADDWSIIRLPGGSDELKKDGALHYCIKMTKEGREVHSAFGKVKDLSSFRGVLGKLSSFKLYEV